jgi:IPT/TIG domain-containing protein
MKNRLINFLILILLVFIVTNIFFLKITNIWFLIVLLLLAETIFFKFSITSKIYYLFALLLLPIIASLLVFRSYDYAEDASRYVFAFLILEFVHSQVLKIFKIKYSYDVKLSHHVFFRHLKKHKKKYSILLSLLVSISSFYLIYRSNLILFQRISSFCNKSLFELLFKNSYIYQIIYGTILLIIFIAALFIKKRNLIINLFFLNIILIAFNIIQHSINLKTIVRFEDKPIILTIQPEAAYMWEHIKVLGCNFGEIREENSNIYIGDYEHRVLKWSKYEVVFVVDPIKSKTGDLYVVAAQNRKSNQVKFTYKEL